MSWVERERKAETGDFLTGPPTHDEMLDLLDQNGIKYGKEFTNFAFGDEDESMKIWQNMQYAIDVGYREATEKEE